MDLPRLNNKLVDITLFLIRPNVGFPRKPLTTVTLAIRVFLLISFLLLSPMPITSTIVGVNYRTKPSLPSPEVVVAKFKELKLSSVRLPVTHPKITEAFIDLNISLLITLPNNMIHSIANECANALLLIYEKIHAFYPRVKFYGGFM